MNRTSSAGEIKGRIFALESKRTTMECSAAMSGDVTFTCLDYRDVEIPPRSIIYADPPYAGTLPYKGVEPFDSEIFWEYMRRLAHDGHTVFISEINGPDDIPVVWQKEYGGGMKNSGITASKTKRIEKLFMLAP